MSRFRRSNFSADPEFLVEQRLQFAHGGVELVVKQSALRIRRKGQGIGHAVGKTAVGIGLANLSHEREHPLHAGTSRADIFQCSGLGAGTGSDIEQLSAVEEAAADGALIVDRAGARTIDFPMEGAGLKEEFHALLTPKFQADCRKLAG